jgi:hypothetical protein
MTPPVTSSKLVLVERLRIEPGADSPPQIRRYRLARVQLDCRSSDPASRFEYLKRVYD